MKGGGASKLLTAGTPLSSYNMAEFFYGMFSCENRAPSHGAVAGLPPPPAVLPPCVQLSVFVIQQYAGVLSSYSLFCRESSVEKQGGKIL